MAWTEEAPFLLDLPRENAKIAKNHGFSLRSLCFLAAIAWRFRGVRVFGTSVEVFFLALASQFELRCFSAGPPAQ